MRQKTDWSLWIIRLFTDPYFVFTRRSGSSTYRYGQPSWVHMHRGGWCQFDTHPPTRSGTFETKMVNHSAKCNILTILWKEETDKNLHQPTNNLESSHFHIILAKLERCTCRRCLRAWGVKEQKDKECRKGQKKKNAVHFLPHPSPCFSFALLLYTPIFLPCFSSSTKKKREDGYGGQPIDQQADWSIHSYWQIIKSFFLLWIPSLSLRTNPSFTCLFYVSLFLTKRN